MRAALGVGLVRDKGSVGEETGSALVSMICSASAYVHAARGTQEFLNSVLRGGEAGSEIDNVQL
eukprot:6743167-Pyramimonas_sp.AAC.1